MNITYSYDISDIKLVDIDGLSNVVESFFLTVEYTYPHPTNTGETLVDDYGVRIHLDSPDQESFIQFNDLTESIFLEWIENAKTAISDDINRFYREVQSLHMNILVQIETHYSELSSSTSSFPPNWK